VSRPASQVWRKGWKQEAAATQAASACIAEVIGLMQKSNLPESAEHIRQAAMIHGSRKAVALLQKGLMEVALRARRREAA
jgi:hypothetical protein